MLAIGDNARAGFALEKVLLGRYVLKASVVGYRVGQRAIMTDNLDKKVIDVTRDLAATGGMAVDALQNVPSVSVDQNGAVSLRGSTNVKYWWTASPPACPWTSCRPAASRPLKW